MINKKANKKLAWWLSVDAEHCWVLWHAFQALSERLDAEKNIFLDEQ